VLLTKLNQDGSQTNENKIYLNAKKRWREHWRKIERENIENMVINRLREV
jgi:hypothetical protein